MPVLTSCQGCGKQFEAARSTARFCSGACRVAVHRRKTKAAADPQSLPERLKKARVSGIHPLIGSKGSVQGVKVMDLLRDRFPGADLWVEPFFGSGALMLEAVKAGVAVPGAISVNDANDFAIRTIWAIRNQPEELAARLALTPQSRAEHDQEPDEGWDDVALSTWWLHRSFSGYVGSHKTSRFVPDRHPVNYRLRKWKRLPGRILLLAEVLRECTVQNIDALDFIRRECDGKRRPLVVCDPPYPGAEDSYRYVWSQHGELAALLHQVPAEGVVVTYSDHPLIERLYPESHWEWHRFERQNSIALAQPGQQRPTKTEVVLIRRTIT